MQIIKAGYEILDTLNGEELDLDKECEESGDR